MQAVWIVAIVVGVIAICGYSNYIMWKNRVEHKRQAELRAKRDAEWDAEKEAMSPEEYRRKFGGEKTVKGIAGAQQDAGAHGVAMQFHLAAMPQNVTPQYVTVVTHP